MHNLVVLLEIRNVVVPSVQVVQSRPWPSHLLLVLNFPAVALLLTAPLVLLVVVPTIVVLILRMKATVFAPPLVMKIAPVETLCHQPPASIPDAKIPFTTLHA